MIKIILLLAIIVLMGAGCNYNSHLAKQSVDACIDNNGVPYVEDGELKECIFKEEKIQTIYSTDECWTNESPRQLKENIPYCKGFDDGYKWQRTQSAVDCKINKEIN